ncbi:MAG: hypothetical protein ACLU36_11145 [Barnesiella intestinihominis]
MPYRFVREWNLPLPALSKMRRMGFPAVRISSSIPNMRRCGLFRRNGMSSAPNLSLIRTKLNAQNSKSYRMRTRIHSLHSSSVASPPSASCGFLPASSVAILLS